MLSLSCFVKGCPGAWTPVSAFRCKEFPADLVESLLSHSPCLLLLEKLLDLISCRCCQLVSQLVELSLVFPTWRSFFGSEGLFSPRFTITKYLIDNVITQRSQSTHCRWDTYLFEKRYTFGDECRWYCQSSSLHDRIPGHLHLISYLVLFTLPQQCW